MTDHAPSVSTRFEDGVGWITISNPAKKNALSASMMARLAELLADHDADDTVAAIVIRGDGPDSFIAGADIGEFESQQTLAVAREESDRCIATLFGTLDSITTPVIAMIDGYCIGAGLAVALHADIRIASEPSTFAIPAARLGLGYPVDQVAVLTQAVGPAMASEVLFTATTLTSSEALRTGLLNRVVDRTELESTTRSMTRTIAANAPLTIHAAKSAIRAARVHTEANRTEAIERTNRCADSADIQEGQRAFMQKRRPVFTGR